MADYPDSLKYTKEHEWARIAGNKATIGITPFAKDQLGDVVYLELPEVGAQIVRGEPFGVVESTKAVSELFAPLTGHMSDVIDGRIVCQRSSLPRFVGIDRLRGQRVGCLDDSGGDIHRRSPYP